MITIRREAPGEAAAVREVNERAFGGRSEADAVDAIRRDCAEHLSLVADDDGVVVGHVFFSPATVEVPPESDAAGPAVAVGMGLAPLSVVPGRQRQGIGAALVESGLEVLREAGCPFVVVLGHPAYYPRFGFVPASRLGLVCQYDGVPDDAFMALELVPGALDGVAGTARYRAEFDEAV